MITDRKFRILSIDGGGLRGVIPIQFIKHIESITGQEVHKTFDLIAGTSTGGILTSALTLSDKDNVVANTRKLSMEEIEGIYVNKGKEIFPFPNNLFNSSFVNILKWFRPQFSSKPLDFILKSYFGDTKISSCLKPIYISTFDLHRNKPLIFTYREASILPNKNSTLMEVCRATSAAPTYFPTFTFNYDSERITCIDGGICMNNPVIGSLVEVLGNPDYKNYTLGGNALKIDDISILSLGTGYTNSLIDSNKAYGWGRIKWIKPVIDLSLNAPVMVAQFQIETLFKSFNLENNYLRLDVHIDNKYSEMSDSREDTLRYLINKSNQEISSNDTLKLKINNFLKHSGVIMN